MKIYHCAKYVTHRFRHEKNINFKSLFKNSLVYIKYKINKIKILLNCLSLQIKFQFQFTVRTLLMRTNWFKLLIGK